MSQQPLVTGEVRFEPQPPPFGGARLRVQLQDVTQADAPARVVAEQVIEGVSRGGETTGVPFTLLGSAELDPRSTYILSAHLDLSNSGEITPGDFITMESFPVRAGDRPARVDVTVRRVG